MPFNLTAQLNVQRKTATLNTTSVKFSLLFRFSYQRSRDPEQKERRKPPKTIIRQRDHKAAVSIITRSCYRGTAGDHRRSCGILFGKGVGVCLGFFLNTFYLFL